MTTDPSPARGSGGAGQRELPGPPLGPDADGAPGAGAGAPSVPVTAVPPSARRVPPAGPGPSTGWAIARLVAVLGALVAVFLLAGLGDLLLFIACLVLIVVVHELGHFATAKWSHMKVTEYFIGFGPRLWSVRRGETEYGIKPILAGAYVKIPGMTNLEEVDPDDEARTYRRQPFHRRIIVASAGSFIHGVMAFGLAWVAVVSFGVPHGTSITVHGFTQWAGRTTTAAQAAGLEPGDRILSVDGKAVSTGTALSRDIQASHGKPITMTVQRDGKRRTLTVIPQLGYKTSTTTEVIGTPPASAKGEWFIGVQDTVNTVFTSEGPVRAIGTAGANFGHIAAAEVTGLGHVFSPGGLTSLYDQVTSPTAATKAANNPTGSNRITSVVGAARLATQATHQGIYYLFEILIALNIVLGLLNMLPMLPLDGGHVVIALYERIRTRRGRPYYQADVAKLLPVAYAFMAVLLVIVGSAVFLDIAHPIANPFG